MTQLSQNPIGQSPAWLATLDRISDLAAADTSLIIIGERGTGKSMVAERLHFLSPRWEENYLDVNGASFHNNDLEAFLFGGRAYQEAGIVKAQNGTLFIANIEKTPPSLQARLLLLIERGLYLSFDGEPIPVNIRVILASQNPLPQLAKQGNFDAKLLDIASVDVISLPPLRARKSDIEPLAQAFAMAEIKRLGLEQFGGFSAEALEILHSHDWPGNIRELKTVIERAVIRHWGEQDVNNGDLGIIANIGLDAFASPWSLMQTIAPEAKLSDKGEVNAFKGKNPQSAGPHGTDFKTRSQAFEKSLITEALQVNKNHQGKAAKYLGLSYHQFRGLLRKYGLKT